MSAVTLREGVEEALVNGLVEIDVLDDEPTTAFIPVSSIGRAASTRAFPFIPQTPTSMRFPYAVDIDGDTMVVADTANNRILVRDTVPTNNNRVTVWDLSQ